MKTTTVAALVIVTLLCLRAAHAVTFEWATIGNPGNADDSTGFGGVNYRYRISKYEVTNAQYAEFLNTADADPAYSLAMDITRSGSPGNFTYAVKSPAVGQGFGGSDYTYDDKPVTRVTFFGAMRFVNWLHNGQGIGDTESGAYINNFSDGVTEVRSANARFWIPSEDEWYKAAYYDPNGNGGSGVYYDYPTGTDAIPNNNFPSADTGNSANFNDMGPTTGNSVFPLTDVGAYALSESPYGTYDQGGNAREWNEAVIDDFYRGARGGGYADLHLFLRGDRRQRFDPFLEFETIPSVGFRVASIIPEPSTILIGTFALAGLLTWRKP